MASQSIDHNSPTQILLDCYKNAATPEERERVRGLIKMKKRGLHEAARLAKYLASVHEKEEKQLDSVLWPPKI